MADTLDLRRAVMQCGECKQHFGVDATFCPFDGTKLESVAWDPRGDPLLGRVIDGRYEVVGVLGEGGMGVVYSVRHIALDRIFAMKALRRELARDSDLSARFMREARATARVKHPNIVAITDFGRLDADVPYFVMEQLVGDTLSHTIKTGGPIPAATGVTILLQIANALEAAHEAKIVHRDLKPDNVFLLVGAHGGVDVRVVDFGASMILGASRTTKTGIVFGTPHYMSPEQASGQPVDHRADIYALGVIMYEMFTGRVPFVADTYMGVLTQHMFVKPVPPSQANEQARNMGPLEGILLRALEKKPEDRFPTMRALADEIQRVSSFGADGASRVASGPEFAGASARPLSGRANPLEPPTREEISVHPGLTASGGSMGRGRPWGLYAAVALAVAALALGVERLLTRRTSESVVPSPVLTAVSTSGPVSPQVAPTAPSSSTSSAPVAVIPLPAPSGAPGPPRPLQGVPGHARPAPRPGAAASTSRKAVPTVGSDFADPWARPASTR